ncbi:protein-glutamate O-methyltransferase CheR [Teredinibacter sp. KSP-S5-2]|uniref:CheR family methyltransferase n=1 Tax=Teredinibacter sp. KSP-S5-2 TaxID=3034506 RepID=UPI0029342B35|nr:protein-glutamate O-methyltransferase CheR [Teredinibacter sp. KSP-S5-2]WNO08158.1 protein-glutamate O-methyltransferase CheR [Teredinibacter sp. KSP-S5-2]
MSKSEFVRLQGFIESQLGIKTPVNKLTMLETRLNKRLNALGMSNFGDYLKFSFSNCHEGEKELQILIDLVSTHKTDFFRDPSHFDFLYDRVLPDFFRRKNSASLNMWSAACSTGEEAYTMAMIAAKYFRLHDIPLYRCQIMATDISIPSLQKARAAIYPSEAVTPIDKNLSSRFLLKSKKGEAVYRIVPELRQRVYLSLFNLITGDYRKIQPMDVIFCRNVLIYFNKENKDAVIEKLLSVLKPKGYLFIGPSEGMLPKGLPIKNVSSTVYQYDP